MTNELISHLIHTFQQHPMLALLFIFLISFTESLVVIGLLVAGAIIMSMFGALIAINALDFWPTVFAAILGAVLGDSLSYWIGFKYQRKFYSLWPLSRHPKIIERANQFFNQHGAKSIFFGRFIGPIRPIVPALAGMAKMPPKTFLMANVSSAFLWAPLYLLPGILFGLSLEVASEFTRKFIFLIIILLTVIFILLWLVKYIYQLLKPFHEKFITKLLGWGRKHPLLGEIPASVFDNTHSEVRGLSMLAFIIIVISLLISISINYIDRSYNLSSLNVFLYHNLNTLHSPPFNAFMLWFNYLSQSTFIYSLLFSISILLLWKKDYLALWHFLAAIFLPYIILTLIALLKGSSTQFYLDENNLSIHPIIIISIYGFITFLFATHYASVKKRYIYYISATVVAITLFSQVYFHKYTFIQIMYSIAIGSIWFSILGIAYRRHRYYIRTKKTSLVVLMPFLLLLSIPSIQTYQHENSVKNQNIYFIMSENGWLESGWQTLPLSRTGIFNNHNTLLNLQWSGSQKNIEAKLEKLGFEKQKNSLPSVSNIFVEKSAIASMPIFPHIHNGEYESLRFTRNNNNESMSVIRLWPSNYQLSNNKALKPLWFGSITIMNKKNTLGLSYLFTKYENANLIKKFNTDLLTPENAAVKNLIGNYNDKRLFLIK